MLLIVVPEDLHPVKTEFVDNDDKSDEMFEEEFTIGITKGGEKYNIHYMHMFFYFGDVFVGKKYYNRDAFLKDVVNRNMKVSDLITGNNEALMRTILEAGCWNDWREYRESDLYKSWKEKYDKTPSGKKKPKKPVSEHYTCSFF